MQGASLRMKGVVYKACVHSMLTYGAETWAMEAGVFQRLRATERRMLRMICGVTLKDMVESMVTASKVGVNDLELHLRQKRLRWFGHIVRRDGGGDKESVGVENRRTANERQASETMD